LNALITFNCSIKQHILAKHGGTMADMAVNYGGMMADKRSLPLCWLRPFALQAFSKASSIVNAKYFDPLRQRGSNLDPL